MVVFFDTIGRTIFGEMITEHSTDEVLAVKNPAVVSVTQGQNQGQMTLQLFPAFFNEFLGDRSQGIVWKYNRKHITETVDHVTFDFKLYEQYKGLVTPQSNLANVAQPSPQTMGMQQPAAPENTGDPAVRLFPD